MSNEQAVELLGQLEEAGVQVWVDGGWGVDALIGYQTREHDDLDLVIPSMAVAACRAALEARGFVVERDWFPTAIAFRHVDGRGVDLHPIEPTEDGGGDQVQLDGITRWHYPAPTNGTIGGVRVRCCSLECQVASHLGYEPDDNDRADMWHLADAFSIELPVPYGSDRASRESPAG